MDAVAGNAFWDGVNKGDVERQAWNVAESSESRWSFDGGTLEELVAAGLRLYGQSSTAHAA
jgi:hypothetical protein